METGIKRWSVEPFEGCEVTAILLEKRRAKNKHLDRNLD